MDSGGWRCVVGAQNKAKAKMKEERKTQWRTSDGVHGHVR